MKKFIIINRRTQAQSNQQGGKNMKKYIIISAIVVLLLAVLGVVVKYTGILNFETSIDKTAKLVYQVKSTAEFTSVCFYDEFVMNYVKENGLTKSKVNQFLKEKMNTNIASKDRLVLICKGKVRAGFDLKKVDESDIQVQGDTLSIALPEPQYFDVILNPSDFEYFDRTGEWSTDQDAKIKQSAEKRLLKDAEEQHILQKAETIGLARLESMYKGLGFSVVNLTIKRSDESGSSSEAAK